MIRLLVGLHYLKHAFNPSTPPVLSLPKGSGQASDESVLARWVENPYWQYFCGFETFQTTIPVVDSNLSQWRKRIGPEQMELLLKALLDTGKRKKIIKRSDLERVNVDTTVQEKNLTYPTDAIMAAGFNPSTHSTHSINSGQASSGQASLRTGFPEIDGGVQAPLFASFFRPIIGCFELLDASADS